MTDIHGILDQVRAYGVSLRVDGSDLVIRPADRIPAELKARLREHKPQIIEALASDLEASRQRLEAANVSVAVWPDGNMRIVASWDTWPPGATVWTPGEMLLYVTVTESESALIRGLKEIRRNDR